MIRNETSGVLFMKHKSIYDIGEPVKIIQSDDVLHILKVMSTGTWINQVPTMFIDILNSNYDATVKAVRYVPNIYFRLNDKFKNDHKLIKATIKGFQKHNKSNELNIEFKPLMKRVNTKL